MNDPENVEPPASLSRRLGWFVLLWLAGVLGVSVVGYAIRLAIVP